MKTLHLIRHAKSSWKDPTLSDTDRPLNKRGKRSCKVMADKLPDAGCRFDAVFCSPALRAQATIQTIARALPGLDIRWQTDSTLYTFEVNNLIDWCRQLPDRLDEVVIVGHNPALTRFINQVGNLPITNLPTCAWARLTGEFESWQALAPNTMALTDLLKPKRFLH